MKLVIVACVTCASFFVCSEASAAAPENLVGAEKPVLAPTPPIRITEFLARNTHQSKTSHDAVDAPDWIELHNGSSNAVALGGWHLTDDPKRLEKWTFPPTNISGGGYLLIYASGQ